MFILILRQSSDTAVSALTAVIRAASSAKFVVTNEANTSPSKVIVAAPLFTWYTFKTPVSLYTKQFLDGEVAFKTKPAGTAVVVEIVIFFPGDCGLY